MKLALRDLLYFRFEKGGKPVFFSDAVFAANLARIISPEKASKLFTLTDELTVSCAQNANVFSALSEFHLAVKKLTRSS